MTSAAGKPLVAAMTGPANAPCVIGNSPAFQKILLLIGRIAPTDHTLLISGPTGSGKEVVAQLVHHRGRRAALPFIDLNCGAIPESLVESELFGYTRGAFTGANTDRRGHFEMAGDGTLFLDEIGELPLAMQAKLLRVLETKTFRPLGAQASRRFTGRVVAATHRNLEDLVREGKFREDLYYRLAVFAIELPGLDQRKEDIAPLAQHFASLQRTPLTFSAQALERLREHTWPGHIRQLRNMVDRLAILTDSTEISLSLLEPFLTPVSVPLPLSTDMLVDALIQLAPANKLDFVEQLLIDRALILGRGSKTAAAAILGVNRKVVERRLLTREKNRSSAEKYLTDGRRMLDDADFRGAITTLQRGLTLLDGIDGQPDTRRMRFELHRMLAVCHRSTHGWLSEQAQGQQEAALQAGQDVVDTADLNSLLFGIWTTQLMTMRLGAARATAQDMLNRAHATANPIVHAEAHIALANTMYWLGDSEEVLACLARGGLPGVGEVVQNGAQGFDLVGLALTFDGLASFQLGYFERAQHMREQLTRRSAAKQPNAFNRAISLQGAAWLACLFEDNGALGDLATSLERLARDNEFGFYRGIGQIFCGCHQAALGDYLVAESVMRDGYETYIFQHGGKLFHSFQAWKRAEALLAAGRPAECEALVTLALEAAREHNDRAYLSELLCTGGLAKYLLGDLDSAEEELRSALSTAQALGSVPGRIGTAIHLAGLLERTGRRSQAIALIEKSIRNVERVVPYPGLERALQLLDALKEPDFKMIPVEEL